MCTLRAAAARKTTRRGPRAHSARAHSARTKEDLGLAPPSAATAVSVSGCRSVSAASRACLLLQRECQPCWRPKRPHAFILNCPCTCDTLRTTTGQPPRAARLSRKLLALYAAAKLVLLQVDLQKHAYALARHLRGQVVAHSLRFVWGASINHTLGKAGNIVAHIVFSEYGARRAAFRYTRSGRWASRPPRRRKKQADPTTTERSVGSRSRRELFCRSQLQH